MLIRVSLTYWKKQPSANWSLGENGCFGNALKTEEIHGSFGKKTQNVKNMA
jgi:hypothetical protein